jgi:hypothetical protein
MPDSMFFQRWLLDKSRFVHRNHPDLTALPGGSHMDWYRITQCILTICGLYSFCILQNFLLGDFFVFAILIEEILAYKQKQETRKVFIAAWAFVLLFTSVLTYFKQFQ